MKIFLRIKTSQIIKHLEKLGIPMQPRLPFLMHLELLVSYLFCHPNNTAKIYGSLLLMWLITTENYHKNQVIYSFIIQLMMINTRRLFHIMKSAIKLKTRMMKILCKNSNAWSHMGDTYLFSSQLKSISVLF